MDISSLRERSSRAVLTVSELNGYIKSVFDLDRTLTAVSVKGEISNFVSHSSGHLYFSIKDTDSQIRAVMFRSSAQKLKFVPQNGMKVVVRGAVTVYQRDGSYQIYASTIEPDGVGALYMAYEQLKEKLFLEGLFDEANKRELPEYPECVGVITSPTGAAVRDIINVIGRRCPGAKIYLYPSLVQGDGAVNNMLEALDYFEKTRLCDVLIIGRGGGSIEDLWAFNSEELARKIFSMTIPVISAVGHETDFTICDFVADMRAPTPSAAAELAVPDFRELLLRLDGMTERINSALCRTVERKREKLENIKSASAFSSFDFFTQKRRDNLAVLNKSLTLGVERLLKDKRTELVINAEKLNALSPLSVLSRGYAIVQLGNAAVKSVAELSLGESLNLRLYDGKATVSVTEITKNEG